MQTIARTKFFEKKKEKNYISFTCLIVVGAYREGLSTRPVAGSDEIQLRIDPVNADLDDEITGLRSQVKQLRNVSFFKFAN